MRIAYDKGLKELRIGRLVVDDSHVAVIVAEYTDGIVEQTSLRPLFVYRCPHCSCWLVPGFGWKRWNAAIRDCVDNNAHSAVQRAEGR